MSFEEITPHVEAKHGIPADGIMITARRLMLRNKSFTQYIKISIGSGLALRLSLKLEQHRVRLLFGTGPDAGKIKLSVDNEAGKFRAKRRKNAGNYIVTLSADTADGLFALDFPAHIIPHVEAIRPENGQPVHCIFKASAAMLAVDD